jgi:hypothetical protein
MEELAPGLLPPTSAIGPGQLFVGACTAGVRWGRNARGRRRRLRGCWPAANSGIGQRRCSCAQRSRTQEAAPGLLRTSATQGCGRGGTHACGGELGRRKPGRAELPKVVGHSSASGQQARAGRGEMRDEWGSSDRRGRSTAGWLQSTEEEGAGKATREAHLLPGGRRL